MDIKVTMDITAHVYYSNIYPPWSLNYRAPSDTTCSSLPTQAAITCPLEDWLVGTSDRRELDWCWSLTYYRDLYMEGAALRLNIDCATGGSGFRVRLILVVE